MGSGMKKAQIYSMIGTMGKMPAADDPDALAFRKTTSLVRLAADCHSRCSLWATTGGKGMILNSAKNTTQARTVSHGRREFLLPLAKPAGNGKGARGQY